jgi:D-tyrosyl-tRNA(Tyr) deacylase
VRALVQRVRRASVRVDDDVVGAIGPGLAVLLGVAVTDTNAHADALARKIVHLRIFDDDAGRLNRSLLDVGGAMLVVSQFTLYGDTSGGRRPSFVRAAPPAQAEPLCDRFVSGARGLGVAVATGRFRATMLVEIHNDGPVTLVVDADD